MDQEQAGDIALRGLVQQKGGDLPLRLGHGFASHLEKTVRTVHPLLEIVPRVLQHDIRRQCLGGAGQFVTFRVVEQIALFEDIHEEKPTLGQHLVDVVDGMDDIVDPAAAAAGFKLVFQIAVVGDITLIRFFGGDDENIEIGAVFVGDVILFILILYPIAPGMGTEENDHLHVMALPDGGDDLIERE